MKFKVTCHRLRIICVVMRIYDENLISPLIFYSSLHRLSWHSWPVKTLGILLMKLFTVLMGTPLSGCWSASMIFWGQTILEMPSLSTTQHHQQIFIQLAPQCFPVEAIAIETIKKSFYLHHQQQQQQQQQQQHQHKTWCQILCTMRLQCVSKILTPRRMFQKTWMIAKINLWTNIFQNMYDML